MEERNTAMTKKQIQKLVAENWPEEAVDWPEDGTKEDGINSTLLWILDDASSSGNLIIPDSYCEDPDNATDDEALKYFAALIDKYNLTDYAAKLEEAKDVK